MSRLYWSLTLDLWIQILYFIDFFLSDSRSRIFDNMSIDKIKISFFFPIMKENYTNLKV